MPMPMPGPQKSVHIHLNGPLPSSEYILVNVDVYSRFPIAEIVRSTAVQTIVPKLDEIFAIHGLPGEIVTDIGPPFNSTDFERYLITF